MALQPHEQNRLNILRKEQAEREALERKESAEREKAESAARTNAERLERISAYKSEIEDAERRRTILNKQNLPELSSPEQLLSLPMSLRAKYYTAFGGDYQRELEQRSKCGLSDADWNRLLKAEAIPEHALDPEAPVFE